MADLEPDAGHAPPDPDLPDWQQRLENARHSAPADLKAAADKWASTVAVLAGAAGTISVIFVPKAIADFSDDGLRIVAVVLLTLAAASGLAAIALATWVAQGWPTIDATMDAAAYKRLTLDKLATGVPLLQASRWLTIGTVLLILTASGLGLADTLSAPSKGVDVLVVHRDGTAKCLSLADAAKESSVASVTVVASC